MIFMKTRSKGEVSVYVKLRIDRLYIDGDIIRARMAVRRSPRDILSIHNSGRK